MKKTITALLLTIPIFCSMQMALFSQDAFIPLPDLAADPDFASSVKKTEPFTIRFGGWITPTVVEQKTSSSELMTSITTARLWLSSTLWGNSNLYVRVKDSYLAVLREDNTDIDNTSNVFDLDIASVSVPVIQNTLHLSAGRKYYSVGTGLALNGRGDGGEIQFFSRFGDIRAFGMYTGLLAKDDNPYGMSSRDLSDGSKRIFSGASYTIDFLNNNSLYLFGLVQIDKQDEEATARSKYDSQYFGGGVKGVIGDSLSYYAEYIYEKGNSYANIAPLTQEKNEVKAYAITAGLSYYLHTALKPSFTLTYAFGSGDKDASSYVSSTGNTADEDTRFIYFGTFLGGFALRPQLGNLHVGRIGFSFLPFEKFNEYVQGMNFVLYYSYYLKDKKDSPINSGEAALPERSVGQAVDVMLRWPVFFDFSLFINYGIFLPGDAYISSEPERHFIMAGVNIVF